MARPFLDETEKTLRKSFTLTENLWELFLEEAEKLGMNQSEYFRHLIKETASRN